ncbi:orotidine-5'-phosphate decarboxylase [Alkaliphilus crotonatoxidans]
MIDQLIERIEATQNPSVVGLDPRLSMIPAPIRREAYEKYGKTPQGAAAAFYQFNRTIIDHIYDVVPAVKPQIAMYEQYGAPGLEAYIKTLQYARERGMIVIGDIKRGDIASTAQAYSDGHIGRVQIEDTDHEVYGTHLITLNPYLGFDAIEPFLADCKEFNRGLFILVKTSNPNSGQIQNLDVGGKKLYQVVGDLVREWGSQLMGNRGYSQVGAVVGATHPAEAAALRAQMPNNYFLVPGYGAQGAKAKDLRGCFNSDGLGAIVNSSRGIIAAHTTEASKRRFKETDFALAAREAALQMKADLQRVMNQSR